jgi:hypothetical protein
VNGEIEFGFRMGGPTGSRRGCLSWRGLDGRKETALGLACHWQWDDLRGAAEWGDSARWRH